MSTVGRAASGRERLHGTRWDKWIYRCMGPFYAILLLAGLSGSGSGDYVVRAFTFTTVLVALSTTWRGWRLGTLEIDGAGLRAFGALRRWHWSWADLDHVELGTGPMPFAPASRNRPLVVHERNGRTVRLTAVCGQSRGGRPNWLAEAVTRINERIRVEHSRAGREQATGP